VNVTKNAPKERERAVRAATTNSERALALARQVSHPWYRAQALAWVARFAPEAGVVRIAQEALRTASRAEDPYQVVGASAWPIRALIERDHRERAVQQLPSLLESAERIQHPVSRIEALFLLVQAVWPLGSRGRKPVLDRLALLCQTTPGWRAGRALRELALMLADEDETEARRVADSMPQGPYKRQALRRLTAGRRARPRPFFWR
jgi:hypothetical protein